MSPQIQTQTQSITNTRLAIATLALIAAAALAFAGVPRFDDNPICLDHNEGGVVLFPETRNSQRIENYCGNGRFEVLPQCNSSFSSDDQRVVINKTKNCKSLLGSGGVCSNGNGCVCAPGYQFSDETRKCEFTPSFRCKEASGRIYTLGADEGPILSDIKDYCVDVNTLVVGSCVDGAYLATPTDCGDGDGCDDTKGKCTREQGLVNQIETIDTEIAVLNQNIASLERTLSELHGSGSDCSVCEENLDESGQAICEEELGNCENGYTEQLSVMESEISIFGERLSELEAKKRAAQAELDDIRSLPARIVNLELEIISLEAELRAERENFDSLVQRGSECGNCIDSAEEPVCLMDLEICEGGYDFDLIVAETKIAEIEVKIDLINQELSDLRAQL